MRYSFKDGYTLVEILAVMILLAVAGSMVFVRTGKSMAERQNKAFAQEMVSLCRKARRMAVDEGTPISFNISSTQRRCWINDSAESIEIPGKMLIEGEGIHQLNEDVYIIRFYPDGSSDGGELTLSISGRTVYALKIDMLTGILARIEDEV